MPLEVTMCSGEGCALREGCYRHTAEPAGRQDWFAQPPVAADGRTCSQLWRLAPSRAELEARAYQLWEEAGRPEGRALEFWVAAEGELGGPR